MPEKVTGGAVVGGAAVGSAVGGRVGSMVGICVGGITVGASVSVDGICVAVGGTRVGGIFVGGTRVGTVTLVGSDVGGNVAVAGWDVAEGAVVTDGIVVAVAGRFVATRTMTRVVGVCFGWLVGVVGSWAHAVIAQRNEKKKSERSTFALDRQKTFMYTIVATHCKNVMFRVQKLPTASTCLS